MNRDKPYHWELELIALHLLVIANLSCISSKTHYYDYILMIDYIIRSRASSKPIKVFKVMPFALNSSETGTLVKFVGS